MMRGITIRERVGEVAREGVFGAGLPAPDVRRDVEARGQKPTSVKISALL